MKGHFKNNEKNKRLLIETVIFALLAIYIGYTSGFALEFGFIVSQHEISTHGSMSFLFTILALISAIRYLFYKFNK